MKSFSTIACSACRGKFSKLLATKVLREAASAVQEPVLADGLRLDLRECYVS
jgi:hypothetical protein